MAACPAARSFFVWAAPTDVNEFVVRARRSLGDQAIALGLDVGGRIRSVLPDEKNPPLAGASFLELVHPVPRRQRQRRHGSDSFPRRSRHASALAGTGLFSSLARRSSNSCAASART